MAGRRVCLTFDPSRRAGFLDRPEVPAGADVVELRADLLPPDRLASGAWRDLPRGTGAEWTFTWRSPEEGGGGGPLPPGARVAAVEAGFRWIDVEARELDSDDGAASEVPRGRRWVSAHPQAAPAGAEELGAWFARLRSHAAGLHKLVVPAPRFEVARWVLELVERSSGGTPPFTAFAQGDFGHVSRVVGGLRGNHVTFAAASEASGTAPGQPLLERLLRVYRFAEAHAGAAVYGVVGNPALQSRSPDLHNAAFAREGIAAIYVPLPAEAAAPVVDWLRAGGAAGLSVTAPFKEEAARLADVVTPRAAKAGAVNTLWMEDGALHADNTDVEAAETLLKECGPGGAVAVLGAGGAAAAVVVAARNLGRHVTVYNRTPGRAAGLAARLGVEAGGGPADLRPDRFAVVVNATPAEPPGPIADLAWEGVAVIDLAYGPGPGAWERLAAERGAKYCGGLRFLAEQAAGQFARWTGRRLPAGAFLETLRA